MEKGKQIRTATMWRRGCGSLVVLFLAAMLISGKAYATPLSSSFGFYRITANSSIDVAAQLQGNLYNYEAAKDLYDGIGLGGDGSILFTFANNVGEQSSITEVYFDGGPLDGLYGIHNSLGGYTHFGLRTNPENLPGGRNIILPFVADFSVDARGNPEKGIDTSDDILGISFLLSENLGYADVLNALVRGELRIGMRLRGFGDGASDGFVTGPPSESPGPTPTPIPEPATMLLFGTGLVSVAGAVRKKRRSQESGVKS